MNFGSVSDDDVLSVVATLEKSLTWLQAMQVRALAEFARRRPGYLGEQAASVFDEHAGDEVAAVLHIAPRTGASRLDWAIELSSRLPKTLAAMENGQVTYAKALVMSEETAQLDPATIAAVEERCLDGADQLTPTQLRRRVKRAVIAVDADAAKRRAERARDERRVAVLPRPDGMTEFWALLPAQDATALFTRLTDLARGAGGDGQRTMDQRRADALSDLIYGNAGPASSPLVQLVMTDATLIGGDNQPAELIGYGPVIAATARKIAADSIWQALQTDSTGTIIGLGRRRYRPSARLADLIRSRDRRCRFPGCGQPANRTDIDHTVRYPSGMTEEGNLACLCRTHHLAKTAGQSRTLEWTSPTHRTYITQPPKPLM